MLALHLGMSTPASPDEIKNILGDLDPLVFEQIVLMDASIDEVAEAYAMFEVDRQGEMRRPMSPRVAQIYSIIEEAFGDIDEREWRGS